MVKSNFRFTKPHIKHFIYKENSEFIKNYAEHGEEREKTFEVHPQLRTRINNVKDADKAYVSLELKINSENNNFPYELEVIIAATFEWDEKINTEKARKMLRVNAPALLLGYMRPLVSMMTGMSRFPIYDIPFVNFHDTQK